MHTIHIRRYHVRNKRVENPLRTRFRRAGSRIFSSVPLPYFEILRCLRRHPDGLDISALAHEFGVQPAELDCLLQEARQAGGDLDVPGQAPDGSPILSLTDAGISTLHGLERQGASGRMNKKARQRVIIATAVVAVTLAVVAIRIWPQTSDMAIERPRPDLSNRSGENDETGEDSTLQVKERSGSHAIDSAVAN